MQTQAALLICLSQVIHTTVVAGAMQNMTKQLKQLHQHAGDEQARWDDFQKAIKIISDDMGVVPVYQKAEGHLVNEKNQRYRSPCGRRFMGLQMDIR